MTWDGIQIEIQACRKCEQTGHPFVVVPSATKRTPPKPPLTPTRLLVVSVAPPWGGDYFWDESRSDRVRSGLFEALAACGQNFTTCETFRFARYFLVPGVKCPSTVANKDRLPSSKTRTECAPFLKREIIAAQPERILAIGQSAMKSVSLALSMNAPSAVDDYRRVGPWWVQMGRHKIPVAGTFFAGTKRHQGFEGIVGDLRELLSLAPR